MPLQEKKALDNTIGQVVYSLHELYNNDIKMPPHSEYEVS
jgi:hypothetical protein